jgi:hypothetical protein
MEGKPFESRLERTIFLPVGQALEVCCLAHLRPAIPGTKLRRTLAVDALSLASVELAIVAVITIIARHSWRGRQGNERSGLYFSESG